MKEGEGISQHPINFQDKGSIFVVCRLSSALDQFKEYYTPLSTSIIARTIDRRDIRLTEPAQLEVT